MSLKERMDIGESQKASSKSMVLTTTTKNSRE